MNIILESLKPAVLGILVMLGIALQCNKANAAETLTVAGGCFWCVESDFESVAGVSKAVSGFTGGKTANPTYKQVTKGGTGHYEAVQITFNPAKISRAKLLNMFFRSIDPTDAGGQFCDRGKSYRSAVFYSGPDEKAIALKAKAEAKKALGQKITTPVLASTKFYPADASHQNYYRGNKIVITRFGPKRQSEAYKRYRKACGRDARVAKLWGNAAPFAHH